MRRSAQRFGTGLILESATWRANADWGTRLGYTAEALAEANRTAIHLLENVRNAYETDRTRVVISGCIGPRGDGYIPSSAMSAQEAEAYHREQIDTFAGSAGGYGVRHALANYMEEAVGIVRAAQQADMPVAHLFHCRDRWQTPDRAGLAGAIEQADEATSAYPATTCSTAPIPRISRGC